jgi:hypothetical protein
MLTRIHYRYTFADEGSPSEAETLIRFGLGPFCFGQVSKHETQHVRAGGGNGMHDHNVY